MRKQRCRPISPVQIRGRIPAAAQQGPSWTAALLGRVALLRSSRSSCNPKPTLPQRHSVVSQSLPSPANWQLQSSGTAWEPARAHLLGPAVDFPAPTSPVTPPPPPRWPVSHRPGCSPWSDPTCAFWGHLVTKLYCGYCLGFVLAFPAGGKLAQEAEPREVGRGAVLKAAASRRWEVRVLL